MDAIEFFIGLLILGLVISICAYISLKKSTTMPIDDKTNDDSNIEDTIFVVISCLAGKEYDCADTLYSLYTNAKQPENVRVTIAIEESNDPTTTNPINIYEMYCSQRQKQSRSVNIREYNYRERREAMLQSMGFSNYKNERYWMCLQSGAILSKDWDVHTTHALYDYPGRNIFTALPGQTEDDGCLPVFNGGVLKIKKVDDAKMVGYLVPAFIFGSSASSGAVKVSRKGNGTLRAKKLNSFGWQLLCPSQVPVIYPNRHTYRRI